MLVIRDVSDLPEGLHCHTLRLTFASVLQYYVRNLDTVRRALGHSSLTTTQVYQHGPYDSKKGEMDVFRKFFAASDDVLF